MKKALIILGAAVVVIYVLATAFVAVDETEIVVITQFGRPTRTLDTAGLALKWPDPVQTAIRLDRRVQAIDSNLGEYLTEDKKNLVASTFIIWRIKDAKLFIRSVKSIRAAERRLSDLVSSELGVSIGRHPLSDYLSVKEDGSSLPELFDTITSACRKPAAEDFGIELIDVRLRRLGFPAQNLRSVYSRMRAERERMAKKYRAEGEEEASKIRAETDKEVRRLLADTYRDAQIARGRGEAEAIRIYADAFKKDPAFYKLTRTLEAYRKVLDDKTTLILSSQSPLFRYLETPPVEP